MKRFFLTSAVAAATLALGACGGSDSSSGETQSSTSSEPDQVVARINGEAVSSAALDAQVQSQSQGGQPASKQQALDRLIDLMVLAQKAEEKGLHEQPEVAAKIKRQRASILAQHLVRAELSNYSPSEDELRQAYKERVSGDSGKEYKASHILLDKEKKAKQMVTKLDEGADFAELAREHSNGPTSDRDGDLGWFQAQQMVEPFGKALKSLEKGQYTQEPVKTRFGWHVIRLDDVRQKEKPKFEDIKGKLRNQLVSQHVQDYIESLRGESDIEITAQDLAGSNGDNKDGGSGSGESSSDSDGGSDEGY